MDELLQKLLDGQAQMLKRFDDIGQMFDGVNDNMKGMNSQLNENNQMLKAILHRTEKFDVFLNTTATKDSIGELTSSIEVLNTRLSRQ